MKFQINIRSYTQTISLPYHLHFMKYNFAIYREALFYTSLPLIRRISSRKIRPNIWRKPISEPVPHSHKWFIPKLLTS